MRTHIFENVVEQCLYLLLLFKSVHCPTKQINYNYQIVKYLFYQLLVYVKIIKTISSVTQTKTNVALPAIHSTVSSFTKTTVHFLFAKFGSIIADVTDSCRY